MMNLRLRIALVVSASAVVFAALVVLVAAAFASSPRKVYVVSPGIDIAAVSVFNCANISFEDRKQAEKYAAERPGTHVFEVSFKEIR